MKGRNARVTSADAPGPHRGSPLSLLLSSRSKRSTSKAGHLTEQLRVSFATQNQDKRWPLYRGLLSMIELPDDDDGPYGLRHKALQARLHAATCRTIRQRMSCRRMLASLRDRRLRLRQVAKATE